MRERRTRVFTLQRTLVACILVYAALLRFDAFTLKWGPVSDPPLLREAQLGLQSLVSRTRPAALGWEPEPFLSGDPYDDLQNARDLRWFYWSKGREPVFTFATKVIQRLFGDRETAVAITSVLFSLLVVWATYLVGAEAFGPWVGLGAAAGMAIERDVIGQSALGFKDEAFGFFLLLSVYGLLRMRADIRWRDRLVCGLAMGGACLTRLTSLSFIVPALAFVGLVDIGRARKESFRSAVTAGLVVVSLLLPFLMTSWIESGDPLYAVNSRIGWYQESLDRPLEERGDTTGFLVSEARRAPVAFLETAFNGLTTYPLKYKWTGFEPWVTGLGRALGWLAVAGLFLFLWTPAGRLLLVVLFTSMIPYIFTWQVPNFALVHHLRYTMHVYPLLLVAAGFAVERAVTATRPVTLRTLVAKGRFKQSAVKAVVTLVLAVGLWSILNAFAYLRLREELRLQRGTIVFAGPRDRVFFRSGWYAPRTVGNVTARFAKARSARIWVPMLAGQAHRVTLRADPYDFLDGSPQHLGILINGVLLTIAPMTLDSDRVGEYVVDVPGDLVTGPLARLDLRATYAMRPGPVPVRQSKEGTDRDEGFDAFVDPDDEVAFRVWAVVVEVS